MPAVPAVPAMPTGGRRVADGWTVQEQARASPIIIEANRNTVGSTRTEPADLAFAGGEESCNYG